MTKHSRFGSAISLIALASAVGGCALSTHRVSSASASDSKANGEIGLATRAMGALNAGNIPLAIDYAERAVARTPNDAGFRALLGSAYFAGGRFKSAEGAYKDSLSINPNQPQVFLKLALVEIGLGKTGEALSLLETGRNALDPADYGLALALAGHPAEAIATLEEAARAPSADSRVRQNLALAFALAGDWSNARTVAAQDVPGDQLDERIQQWMQLAKPGGESATMAALVGVTPAAADPGQPVQLALNKSDTQVAQATPAPAPAPAPEPEPQVALAAVAPEPVQAAPVLAAAESIAPPVVVPAAAEVPYITVPAKASKAASKQAQVRRASAPVKAAPVRAAALSRGNSTAVVQLGSYSNPKNVLTAWNANARRYRALQAYAPMSARFTSPKGNFYRLSVKGFGSVNEAAALCASLRRSGGTCFVRNVAGDTPVQIASR